MAEKIQPESQSGFCHSRETTEKIFSVLQLQEKCREQYQPLFLAFIDLTKAFDSVHRGFPRCVLMAASCPPTLLNITRLFHDGMKARVIIGSTPSEPFHVTFGVKPENVIAPALFVIFIAFVMHLIQEKIPQHN